MASVIEKIIETLANRRPLSPKETAARERHARGLIHPNGLSSARISPSRVRLVVFRDDKGVKQQLYDSQSNSDNSEEQCSRSLCDMRSGEQVLESSITASNSMPPSRSRSNGWMKTPSSAKTRRAAFIRRPSTDAELLGEMMFGSMPMKTVGNTVKVHYIRSTDQLMLTKVFTTQRRNTMPQCALTADYTTDSCPLMEPASGGSANGSYLSSVEKSFVHIVRHSPAPATKSLQQLRSVSPDTSKHRSSSLSVPILRPHSSGHSLSPSTTPPSPHSPQQLNGSNGISSSLTRRILRSRSTSLENGSELYRRVLKPLDQNSSRKGKKYALGVIICLSELSKDDIRHFQSFLFSHFTLIDAHLERLKEAVEEACHYRGNVISQMLTKGYHTFLESFLSLYEAPRIESPVWLSLVSDRDRRRSVCMQFMEELGSAIVELDTKETKFFLSSLLTAVLTHHLAWVYTVGKQGYDRHYKTTGKSLGVLAESHPYNPLWAQLGDLYGAVSHPLKVARTVVTGQSISVVCRLLYLMTYFIRCSEIQPGFIQALTQELAEKDVSLSKHGSSDTSHDCDSQSHDLHYALEESDLFPVSRASSCTVVSEQEKRVLSPSASIDRETPVVKSHPFSFRTTPLSTAGSSTDSYQRYHANSESECYDRNSETASFRAVRSKSNSLNYSGEYSCSNSLKNSPLVSGTIAKQQQYGHMRGQTTNDGSVSSTSHTLCTCNNRDHPVASKDGDMFGYRQFRCKCHYGDPHSCAFDPKIESMGLCPINNGYVTFDPRRRYSDDKEGDNSLINSVINTPPRNSCDNSSLSSNFSQSPRNVQPPSITIGSPTLSSSLAGGPYNLSPPMSSSIAGGPYNHNAKDTYGMTNAIRTSCTSIDSGYEKSMSMSSFTSSAKDPMSLPEAIPSKPQYSSTGDVSSHVPPSVPSGGADEVKPRARSLCEMEQKNNENNSVSSNLLSGISTSGSLYPKLPSLTPQLVIEDYTLTNRQALEAKQTASLTSTCSSDASTPVGPSSKSATPSPTSSLANTTSSPAPVLQSVKSRAELKRAFFANKGGKAKGIRTIEDSKKKELEISPTARPRSDAMCFAADNHWKTKSCDVHVIESAIPQFDSCTDATDNHLTATPTYFGNRTLADNPSTNAHPHPHHNQFPSTSSNRFNPSWNMCTSGQCPPDLFQTTPQSSYDTFPVNSFPTHKFDPRRLATTAPQPNFGSSNHLTFASSLNLKAGTQPSVSMAVALQPTLILPSDAQSVSSETDSGHCTRSIDDRSQIDVDVYSQASELSNLDNNSELSDADNDVFPGRQSKRKNNLNQLQSQEHRHSCTAGVDVQNPDLSFTASCLKMHHDNPSLLQEKLREYESAIFNRGRPSMLEKFEDFTDVDLPTFDEFCLDEGAPEMIGDGATTTSHRHKMGDFGHSLFAGHSQSYLPDFILHGTSESADDGFLDKLADDLSNMVKHSIIDEPIVYGVGIIADTDAWSVKVMSATKNLHTSDIIVGTGAVKPSQYIKQLLGSVKSIYEMRMPPEFCLSYLEDRLLELNERSQLLTKSLQDNSQDADLGEIVPRALNAINVHQSDIPLLLAISAAHSNQPDVSAFLNYHHMKIVLGKQFI